MIKSITQLLSRLLLLLCVGWGSVASLHAQMQHAVSDLVSGTYYRIKNANTRSEAQAKGYLADESGMVKAQAFSSTDADVQLWLVTAVTGKSGYYTIQNKRTKKYLQGPEDTESKIATSSTATEVYVPKNTKTGRKYETWYNIMTSADAAYSYNWRDDLCMRGYQPNDGKNDNLSGSEWRFEVTYADEDAYMKAEGHVRPVAGDKVYRIFNASSPFSDKVIYEYDNALGSITDDTNDAQYWQLVAQSNGTMAIQNLKTGHYVQSLNGVKDTQYKVGTNPYGFTISENSHNGVWGYYYDIIDTESSTEGKLGLNCTNKPNGAIYSWTLYDGSSDLNSCWHFKDAGLTEE